LNQIVYEAFEVVASEVVFVTHRLSVRTRSKVEFQNITRAVQEVVDSSRIENGVCYVFVPHTTAAVTLNEQADPSVVEDIAEQLEAIVPQHDNYHHSEGNSPAHIKASLFGSSERLSLSGKSAKSRSLVVAYCKIVILMDE